MYNGEECISSSLESIKNALSLLSQVDKEKIEVIISDNQSTDNTKKEIEKFISKKLNLTYFCNEKNVGYDGNIDLLVQRSNARYVWFLGCGEKIKEDSLKRLIEKLYNNIIYTNILLDFDIYDEMKNKIIEKIKMILVKVNIDRRCPLI